MAVRTRATRKLDQLARHVRRDQVQDRHGTPHHKVIGESRIWVSRRDFAAGSALGSFAFGSGDIEGTAFLLRRTGRDVSNADIIIDSSGTQWVPLGSQLIGRDFVEVLARRALDGEKIADAALGKIAQRATA